VSPASVLALAARIRDAAMAALAIDDLAAFLRAHS
jgi:hypothetical protein